MKIVVSETNTELGYKAGKHAAELIREAIAEKGFSNVILATGTSQFETLNQLIREEEIDWSKVTMFHLDEYIGMQISHPASFRKYLKERFLANVPALKDYFLINGEDDAEAETIRLDELILAHPIDVALVGVGENGHLAFNDPPADFDTEKPYLIVNLDEPCRKQQMNEGWFATLEDVPQQAISMSVQQIMKSKHIICSVPDQRKAVAVKNSLENEISNLFPASILQTHPDCVFYLDKASASLLSTAEI
ncbi:glucosamine-6-phosphate deaminase [Dyadobacter subterraneus]|uniref:Glucosamine-6-phosphate deaminase n=1 Tax=Dyadobacter subterraneus TaxID=2773304 RepID=A0ABR9WFT9_9BACT|nr:glucosamine-6-phosphate deaminase [Dyadobacter subterraneus]MBE9464290.1 glucosamine-6-phosphate deaminase [Dyadobacter subterraneus]